MPNDDFITTKLDPTDLDVRLDDIYVALNKMNKHSKRQEFEGKNVTIFLNSTDVRQDVQILKVIDPYVPWISAFIVNRGPFNIMIGINEPKYFTIQMRGTRRVDHSNADERIHTIFYICNAGDTALAEVTGYW